MELLKRSKVAEIFGVLPRQIIRWEKCGKIKPVKYVNRSPRYNPEDVAKLFTDKPTRLKTENNGTANPDAGTDQ